MNLIDSVISPGNGVCLDSGKGILSAACRWDIGSGSACTRLSAPLRCLPAKMSGNPTKCGSRISSFAPWLTGASHRGRGAPIGIFRKSHRRSIPFACSGSGLSGIVSSIGRPTAHGRSSLIKGNVVGHSSLTWVPSGWNAA